MVQGTKESKEDRKNRKSTWMINIRMVMVGMESINGRNGATIRIRIIQIQNRLVEYLMALNLLGLLIQMDFGIDTTGSVGSIKPIPLICMQTCRKRDKDSNLLELTHLS